MKRTIDSFWDRTNLYNVNSNFDELFNVVDALKDMSLSLVNDGKLTEQQFQDLQITLNDLVKKGDLTVNDINYNLGKIGLEYLSDEVIQAMAGTAPVNAVAADGSIYTPKLASGSVTTEKTAFVKTGKNIFRVNEITDGQAVSNTTGTLSASQYFVTSNFEPIVPSTQYTQNYGEVLAFYDINKQYVSGLAKASTVKQPRTFTTPSNAYYLRTSTVKEGVDTYNYKQYQIEKGASSTPYEEYYRYIDYLRPLISTGSITGDKLASNTLSLDKLGFTKTSVNLFDKTKAVKGSYVNPSTGALSANTNYYYSDYINIQGASQVTKSNALNLYAFYDVNKQFISTSTTSTQTVTVPSNAVYIRFSISYLNIDKEMLVIGSTLPSTYVPFKIFIPKEYIEENTSNKNTVEDFYGKQFLKTYTADFSKAMNPSYNNRAEIAFIGDSWVAGGVEKQGERLTRPMRERMLKHYADGGIGFVGFANSHIGNGEVSVTLNGTWTQYDEGLGNIAQSKGLDSAMAESSTTGDSIKVQFYEDLDFYEIHTLNTGQWRYNIDGGDWVNVDATTQEVTPITLSLGKHTINIEIVSGTVSFIGSYAYKGTKGAVVHKIGNSGLRAGHIASTDRANWIKQLQRCRANTFGILLGTNEMAQNVSVSQYESDMKEVISRIKEAKPRASIFLIAPSGNKYDGQQSFTIGDYSDVQLKIAKELNLAHVSLWRNLGDYAMTNANGLMYTDGVHPNKNGGYAICNVVYDRLLRLA
ncbi:SGNH/GDSL hydrolase family protein [Staphylococcus chromogenes]|uniref:SGNH/GDSL hydrolase family protein n=1 Tax=Staphylococcus chromogenes TaxID=46126 RepID=UPI00288563A8|nr:GDSL-type esterase/lipase family protein [Staphylococcus chromogenes]MDT0670673.1 GDSL-type esterase/lipase family protein [Staphylococcus chromogenes]